MVKGYDLFGDHGRNLPTPHGMVQDPCMLTWVSRVDQIQIVRLNTLMSLLCLLLTHITRVVFKRGWYILLVTCRKGKDDVYVDADECN